MLASTVQFSTNTKPKPLYQPQPATQPCAVLWPAWISSEPTAPRSLVAGCFRTQQGACVTSEPHPTLFHAEAVLRKGPLSRKYSPVSPPYEHPSSTFGRIWAPALFRARLLLRKEVIQPHLPVRLPCYDFVPIASPTFDGSLHKGWATGFGCYRLS